MAATTGRRGGLIEGINVTPLVDVTLVLLVIFIVTAKILVTPAVPLDLPQASNTQDVQMVFSVAMGRDRTLSVNGRAIAFEELSARAQAAIAADPQLRAVIQADASVAHGEVMSVLDALQSAGIARVAFGATPRIVPSAQGQASP